MDALHKVDFPVPKPLLYCSDTSVVGTEFYIMEHVKGRIFRPADIPHIQKHEKAELFLNAADTLAKLHTYNPNALGLTQYCGRGSHTKRQVFTWARQYKNSTTDILPEAEALIQHLVTNLPADNENNRIVHGDFRLENMIFHPVKPVVIAVLDWELASIGDPMIDLSYCCMMYYWPRELESVHPNFADDGTPTEKEYISRYCRHFGRSNQIPNWEFYMALNFFRVASITQGVYARALQGNASAPNAKSYGKVVRPLIYQALKIIKKEAVGVQPVPRNSDRDLCTLFPISDRAKAVLAKAKIFLKEHVYPADKKYFECVSRDPWKIPPIIETVKALAKKEGLWNLFLPSVSGLNQTEYALIAEETGRSMIAPECFNCAAPDTGNMEVLHLYGSPQQKKDWLEPLLNGDIRSAFCMTEPAVASSDATNMECEIRKENDHYVVNGRKWWSSGAADPRCKVAIVMGRSADTNAPKHRRHSMILVPMDTVGVKKIRPLTVFGYNDAPHGHLEVVFDNVRVPTSNMILGEGRGFEIAQGRLGPGRIHHCMRSVGTAEKALELMCQRVTSRTAFGEPLAKKGMIQNDIALSRVEIDQARLLTLQAARCIDTMGTKRSRKQIALAKIAVPRMACQVIDRAIQAFGGAGVSQDTPLAYMYAFMRTLRIADGPDEVHLTAVAKQELREQLKSRL